MAAACLRDHPASHRSIDQFVQSRYGSPLRFGGLARKREQFQSLHRVDSPGSTRSCTSSRPFTPCWTNRIRQCDTVCTEMLSVCEISVVDCPAWHIRAMHARITWRCSAVPRSVNSSSDLRSSRGSLIVCGCRRLLLKRRLSHFTYRCERVRGCCTGSYALGSIERLTTLARAPRTSLL